MTAAPDRRARRARARLSTAALVLLGVAGLVAAVIVGHYRTTPPTTPSVPDPAPAPQASGDAAAERALATRLMLWLPAEAAQPHDLTTREAGPAITVPAPSTQAGQWIPTAFPQSPEGALAQLAALDQTGVAGGDPDTYGRAYADLALPGAPDVAGSGLYTVLSRFRRATGVAAGEATAGLSVRYEVTHGLVKGTTDDGGFAVVCVLGQLSTDVHGYGTTLGIGDCQAMRWTAGGWRISDGPRAAYASSAWPGTTEAVSAGYRALSGSPR
ncbi:hypothetical protein [Amycolatopsis sp. NBC_01480]|uniref:hypothetical protein n=1 Tax=Amycolatopsis sp. NBC_01480 TaxID=2903562 RepID=UPI002E2A547B|nr:hypothetical protein [Amycolatopsis sp. NBC_01480]